MPSTVSVRFLIALPSPSMLNTTIVVHPSVLPLSRKCQGRDCRLDSDGSDALRRHPGHSGDVDKQADFGLVSLTNG